MRAALLAIALVGCTALESYDYKFSDPAPDMARSCTHTVVTGGFRDIGAPCVDASGCASLGPTAECLTSFNDVDSAGGYCTVPCTVNSGVADCGPQAFCVPGAGTAVTGRCFRTCGADAPACPRPRYACCIQNAINACTTAPGLCLPVVAPACHP